MMTEPTASCPYCNSTCHADWVDTGFGPYSTQVGPFYCYDCGASQIGPYDKERPLAAEEQRFGWYGPGSPLGSSVNAVGGVPVSSAEAKFLYEVEYHTGTVLLDPKEFRSDDD